MLGEIAPRLDCEAYRFQFVSFAMLARRKNGVTKRPRQISRAGSEIAMIMVSASGRLPET